MLMNVLYADNMPTKCAVPACVAIARAL